MTKNRYELSSQVAGAVLAAVFVRSAQAHGGGFLEPQVITVGVVWDIGEVTIRSIRQVENVPVLKGKPGIEIELHNTQRFPIGELDWRLQIGAFEVREPTRRSADHHSLTYLLSLDDWNKLKDGAPLYLTWGYYDAKEKSVRPFSHLDKKMLGKTRQSSRKKSYKFWANQPLQTDGKERG